MRTATVVKLAQHKVYWTLGVARNAPHLAALAPYRTCPAPHPQHTRGRFLAPSNLTIKLSRCCCGSPLIFEFHSKEQTAPVLHMGRQPPLHARLSDAYAIHPSFLFLLLPSLPRFVFSAKAKTRRTMSWYTETTLIKYLPALNFEYWWQ